MITFQELKKNSKKIFYKANVILFTVNAELFEFKEFDIRDVKPLTCQEKVKLTSSFQVYLKKVNRHWVKFKTMKIEN